MTNLTNTKSLLAKLLATENVTVEHGKYQTASFDVKNRILRLPIWKEMSGSLYDLMVLHEVGHALYTPEDGWHGAGSDKGRGYKSFLNVVEDARIERKIKDKYPGGRRSFTQGYLELIKKDFFGLRGVDVEELNLIDKINLHFKGGTVHDITFSDEESEFIEKVKSTRTWEDVVRVTDELYEYAKDHESETDMSDHDFTTFEMSDEDSDDEENDWNEDYDPSDYEESDDSEEMKRFIEGLEAGEEEKEEDSGSSTGTAEAEGESEEKGKSAGESGEGEEDGETTKSESSNSDDVSDNPSNNSMNGPGAGVGTPDFDNVGKSSEPRAITDDNFRAREEELVEDDDKKSSFDYANLPEANLKNIIIDHKEIHSLIRDHYVKSDASVDNEDEKQVESATKLFVEFRNKNKKTVEYLSKEFEMKKAADAHSRTATANSGIIDTSILHTYKYNEHIFKKISVTPDGKNHGLVMVVDWSGSMHQNIKGTLEQMMVLVMFAKRVNIPFEVFLFSDSYPSEIRKNAKSCETTKWTHKDNNGKIGDLMIDAHHLLNVFSSRMRANELHAAYVNMTAITRCYDADRYDRYYNSYRTMPSEMSLGGTPLNASLMAINTFIPEFKAKSNVQIVNLIYLTDGDSSGGHRVWDRRVETRETDTGESHDIVHEYRHISNGYSYRSSSKIIIRDMVTKREYVMDKNCHSTRFSRGEMTNTLVKVLRDKHGVNVVNFFLIPKFSRYDALEFANDKNPHEKVLSGWRKNGYVIGSNYGGWSEIYILKGGHHLVTDEAVLEVKEDAKKGDIKRAFSKFNKNKLQNRVVLSKFVDMVAV